MAQKPSGRRRADVQVKVFEQLDLRSRKVAQEKHDGKRSRAEARAAESSQRIARMLELENSVLEGKSVSFSSRIVSGINRKTFRRNFVSSATFSVAAALFAVFALPANAFSPEVTALAGLSANDFAVMSKETQGLTVGNVESQKVSVRGGAKTVQAASLRTATLTKYRSWSGLTADDFLKNPPFETITPAQIAKVAAKYVGVPYVFGGSTPGGFDCSGYTRYVFAQFGISLAHSVSAQDRRGKRISAKNAQPGDLVIWNDFGHMGIYAGGESMFHAPQPGDSLKLAKIYSDAVHFVRVYK